MKCYIFLIPGFFGFADLGGITYFHHVDRVLTDLLTPRGIEPDIRYVHTEPTASIRSRTYTLYKEIAQAVREDPDAPIHLIGHSTGGLDARLFVSPSVNLLRETEGVGALAERVKSVVTVSTPHLGTPLAFFFNNILGQNLLYVLSMGTIYALRFGRFPLSTLFSIIGVIARLDDRLGWRNTIVDQFYENLLADFDDPQRIVEISEYLEAIRTDQTLLGQLTPGGLDLLNATAQDRKGVRYGCVMTRGKRPSLESFKNIGLDPYRHASHMVYRFLYKLTSFVPDYPSINPIHRAFLEREYGDLPETDASDGIVPTWSQLHGTPIHATWADHLDVCGHFREQESHEPPHVDWLSSGSNFNRRKFEALWADVASFICDEM